MLIECLLCIWLSPTHASSLLESILVNQGRIVRLSLDLTKHPSLIALHDPGHLQSQLPVFTYRLNQTKL